VVSWWYIRPRIMAHAGGRPMKFKTANELQKSVDEYFEKESHITLAGLAVHLGIARSTLYEYNEKDKFSDILKKAREKVEAHYEELMIYRLQNQTGPIFALKNMGWKDKTETEYSGEGLVFKFENDKGSNHKSAGKAEGGLDGLI
jgi:hypothetical protein